MSAPLFDDEFEITVEDADDPTDVDEDGNPLIDWATIDTEEAETLQAIAPAPVAQPLLDPTAARYIMKRRIMSMSKLFEQPPIEWFIEGLLPHVPRTMLVGEGGSFKSFLVLDWMLCAATHRAWFGRSLRPGRVLYMAGEGARGLPKRVKAWAAHNEIATADITNIDFMGEPFELGTMNHEQQAMWARFISWRRYDYVVIDTLHTATSGKDENSNTDMGAVFAAATAIAGGPDGAALFFIHHKPKNSPGARGASSLRDDVDVSIRLRTDPRTAFLAVLEKDKIRDIEEFKPQNIQFERHLPEDSLRSSLYVESVTDTGVGDGKGQVNRTSRVDEAKEAIVHHELVRPGWGEGRVSEELKALDLGYKFSPATVGRALRSLRESQTEVDNMTRNREEPS